ncbi:flavin monoamine oxidase family protein [Kutzneria albida]|uniref:Staurosporine biosynthesis L-amino acid oxidase StaO n=1 Tax=Kutzneria albida DSM 43870 TaxID=1449976 RepID=W5W7S4_9PSEU|nr:NAD(P)/FAD-dependent oxidoreductase [Kutzneria albida]AHH96775.1 Staurosporine biosynthesis L-amino acid oxidase StaO [Kutzneria albida DSM 43870]
MVKRIAAQHRSPVRGTDAPLSANAKRVTVLGAGVAGLVAAHELERLGHRVEVLEGSGRIGGRIHTHRFAAGPLVELGAMRVPADHLRTMHYIAELGLADQVREFRTLFSEDNAYYATDSGPVRQRDVPRVLLEDYRALLAGADYREATVLFGARLLAVGEAIGPAEFRRSLREELGRGLLDLVDQVDPACFLRGRDQVDLHAFFAAHPEARTWCGGRLARFIDDVLSETSPRLIRLEGGMDQIVRRLGERVRGPITCGQEVVGITVRERDVLVDLRLSDQVVTRRCDYVLCTIPFAVLRRLRLHGLSESKMAAIRGVRYWSGTKIAFHCREAFWEQDGITGGASFTGGQLRQTYYPAVEGDPAEGAALLASYTIGEDADVLGRMPFAARHVAALRELSMTHPELLRPGMVVDAVSSAWGQSWWSGGAGVARWGQDALSCEQERIEAARPENRLFFAGEHCSSTAAWINGAIESAEEAVRRIHRYQPRPHRIAVCPTGVRPLNPGEVRL